MGNALFGKNQTAKNNGSTTSWSHDDEDNDDETNRGANAASSSKSNANKRKLAEAQLDDFSTNQQQQHQLQALFNSYGMASTSTTRHERPRHERPTMVASIQNSLSRLSDATIYFPLRYTTTTTNSNSSSSRSSDSGATQRQETEQNAAVTADSWRPDTFNPNLSHELLLRRLQQQHRQQQQQHQQLSLTQRREPAKTDDNSSESSSSLAAWTLLATPQYKRMRSTAHYIYTTLFVHGENSDVTVRALNREWRLHKLYLCQSPYFDSMFKGCKWKESNDSHIDIAVPDASISERAMHIAFGSFYSGEEVEIVPVEAISVLACASLFSLEGLIGQCAQVMADHLSAHTAVAFYEAALVYGIRTVADRALAWLCANLMLCDELRLHDISVSLMETLLARTDELMIVQVETDLYSLCKRWLYCHMSGTQLPVAKLEPRVCNEFFRAHLHQQQQKQRRQQQHSYLSSSSSSATTTTTKDTCCCLLDDHELADKYARVFRFVRYQHIITDLSSCKLLYADRIVPRAWLEPLFRANWLSLIFVDQDKLSHEFEMTERAAFDAAALRFGRLLKDESATWRWVGFNYGVDMVLTHSNRSVSIRRTVIGPQSAYRGLLVNRLVQRIYLVARVNELQQDTSSSSKNSGGAWFKTTELKCIDFGRTDERILLDIGQNVKYPIVFNLRVMVHPVNLADTLALVPPAAAAAASATGSCLAEPGAIETTQQTASGTSA